MEELRRSSPIIQQKSVYTCCKAQFTFFVFFFLPFHLFHRHLNISQVIAAGSSTLRIAGSWTRTRNLWFPDASRLLLSYALFRIGSFTLALVSAVVRRMLKTRVTLGNISRVLLNLIKGLVFVIFKDSSPSQCSRSNFHIST